MAEHPGPEETPVATILRALKERAKELNCLYRVSELLHEPDLDAAVICERLVRILPAGWQFPAICQVRVTLEGREFMAPDHVGDVPWVQAAPIRVQDETAGTIEVSYREPRPRADEGPFLKEERKLIDTVAERVGEYLLERRLRSAFERNQPRVDDAPRRAAWWTVIEFLRGTDPSLLARIVRKMLNQLSWTGVPEARQLVHDWYGGLADAGEAAENRPLHQGAPAAGDQAETVFAIAERHMAEGEILGLLTAWIREEKSSFLMRTLEDQNASLNDIVDALERYRQLATRETGLPAPTQEGLRVSLARRFFSDQLDFVAIAKQYLDIDDYYELLGRVILWPGCHGKLGGKSAGLFLAHKILQKRGAATGLDAAVRVPKSCYVPSDGLLAFIRYNDLEDVLGRRYLEIDRLRLEYPHLVQLFKQSPFPPAMVKALAAAMDEFGDSPLIVRSSSLLEDRFGSAFSGKYKSLFLGNQGPRERRLAELLDAIAEVYASIFGPDPAEYRKQRGLLDVHEEMGILVQEVVGQRVGDYWLPACAGVAFSNNEFRWSPRIRRSDGLIRLVPGLGTRAVDRVVDDYPVLIAPGQPNLRVNATVDELLRYAPKKVDVVDLARNRFDTVDAHAFLARNASAFPRLHQLVSVVEPGRVRPPVPGAFDFEAGDLVFTFDGLVRGTPFVAHLRDMLDLLRDAMGVPVDIEFAWDGTGLVLLQCRPQSFAIDAAPAPIPQDVPPARVIFSADRHVSNGRVPDITHVVYVDPEAYGELPDADSLRQTGRLVGQLNKLLPKRQFVLIGPGRWGSRGDIRLGVPVTYSDINNAAMLIEIARQRGEYVPDLSFGTHFFQDLVEAGIRYLPLYPDQGSTTFNERFLRGSPSVLRDLVPGSEAMERVVRVINVPRTAQGQVLRVLMNADLDLALAYLAAPNQPEGAGAEQQAIAPASDEHWRWRLRMAQRIALHLDPGVYGVVAMYVFGSTKNGTAGPGSDIDLLVHTRWTDEQVDALSTWLRGWGEALAEVNYLRTGYRVDQLLDVHLVTDESIARGDSYAAKIDAITDPARPLPLKTS